jgi:hypothetical protein
LLKDLSTFPVLEEMNATRADAVAMRSWGAADNESVHDRQAPRTSVPHADDPTGSPAGEKSSVETAPGKEWSAGFVNLLQKFPSGLARPALKRLSVESRTTAGRTCGGLTDWSELLLCPHPLVFHPCSCDQWGWRHDNPWLQGTRRRAPCWREPAFPGRLGNPEELAQGSSFSDDDS